MLADNGEHIFNIVAGIDDYGFVGGVIADDRAVTLQWADGNNLVDHSIILAQAAAIHHRSITRNFYLFALYVLAPPCLPLPLAPRISGIIGLDNAE